MINGLSHSNQSNSQEPNNNNKALFLVGHLHKNNKLMEDNNTSNPQVMTNTHHQGITTIKATKNNNLEDFHLTNKLKICQYLVKELFQDRIVVLLLINLR